MTVDKNVMKKVRKRRVNESASQTLMIGSGVTGVTFSIHLFPTTSPSPPRPPYSLATF